MDLNDKILVYFADGSSSLNGERRLIEELGPTDGAMAAAEVASALAAIDDVPPVLAATWPIEKTMDLGTEVLTARYPSLSAEAIRAIRLRWEFDNR